MSRVYVPVTLEDLATFVTAGTVPAGEDRYVAEDESEEAEYGALTAAAAASQARLLAAGRRVVLVAEVADPDSEFGMDRVVAVHADDEEVDVDVHADDLPELGWYATQEIPDLLA